MFINISMQRILIGILLITNLLSNNIDNNPYLESRIRLFEEWMNTQIDYLSLKGISVGVVYKQELVYYKGFGYVNTENQILTDENTNYRIGSVTKLFTSVALMKLIDEGKIKLNDPVVKYIPELYDINTNYNVEKITIKSILQHTTGLPRDPPIMWDGKHKQKVVKPEEALKIISRAGLIYKPNRIFNYSPSGMVIGGIIIERVTGKDYIDYIESNIFKPMEMSASHIPDSDEEFNISNVGYGSLIDGERKQKDWEVGFPYNNAGAGIVSNVVDLSKFVRWHFKVLKDNEDSIISYKTLKKMHKVHWIPIPFNIHPLIMSPMTWLSNIFYRDGWGLGYRIRNSFIGHGGRQYGYRSHVSIYTDNNIGIIVLANTWDAPVSPWDNRSISKNLYQIVGKALLTTNDTYHLEWEEYENTYYLVEDYFYGNYITTIDDKLAIIDLSNPFPLQKPELFEFIGNDSFKVSRGYHARYSQIINFERDNNNNINALIMGDYKYHPKY